MQFQHILRLLNTNVDGRRKIMYALTEIKGVGRRYANIVCKKADVDLKKRYGRSSCLCRAGVRVGRVAAGGRNAYRAGNSSSRGEAKGRSRD